MDIIEVTTNEINCPFDQNIESLNMHVASVPQLDMATSNKIWSVRVYYCGRRGLYECVQSLV